MEKITETNSKSLRGLSRYQFEDRYICTITGNVYRTKLVGDKFEYKPMSPFITRDGYVEYVLTDINGIKKHIQGHRIVAELFIEKPYGKEYVNHKDGNRRNNNVSNLEWSTQSENLKHSYRVLGRRPWNKKDFFMSTEDYIKDFDFLQVYNV